MDLVAGLKWTLYEQHWLAPLANRWLATAVWGLIALVWLTWRVMKRLQKLEKQQKQQREEEKDPLTVNSTASSNIWITGCCACAAIWITAVCGSCRGIWSLVLRVAAKSTLLRETFRPTLFTRRKASGCGIPPADHTPHEWATERCGTFDVDGVLTTPGGDDLLRRRLREHLGWWLMQTRALPAAQRSYPDARSSDLLTADKSRRETLVQNLRQQPGDPSEPALPSARLRCLYGWIC